MPSAVPAQAADLRDGVADDDAWFERWRACELSRIDRQGLTYVDYTGAPPFAASLLEADANRLRDVVHGNPHSRSAPSMRATEELAAARTAVLEFLNADPAEYAVVFTANASAACRLVGEAFPFGEGSAFLLTADNHNSVNGIREFAARGGARTRVLALDQRLRLATDSAGSFIVASEHRVEGANAAEETRAVPSDDQYRFVTDFREFSSDAGESRYHFATDHASKGVRESPSLFAFPAQSNFSGVRHPLDLVQRARDGGWRVLLDAAAYLPTADLDLSVIKPDFLCLSIYKITGYPTGIGALVARHEALAELVRPTFTGGTVRWVSVAHGRHLMAEGPERFEDGTPNFLGIGAVPLGLRAVAASGRRRLGRHLRALTAELLDSFAAARHPNGRPRVRVHGPRDTRDRGPTVAFSLLDPAGRAIPYWEVEEAAGAAGIALRGGCFCNPGCSERAFGMDDDATIACLDRLGESFTIPAFAACAGGHEVGALRVSFGLGSVRRDVERVLAFVATTQERRAQDSNL